MPLPHPQATGMMKTLNKDFAKQMELLRHFIACAAPDGRKMCQAWFNLALCHTQVMDGSAIQKQELLDIIQHGLQAEQNMLPFLREHDSKTPDSSAKKMCLMYQSLSTAERSPPARLCRDVRARANRAFEQCHWEEAIYRIESLLGNEDKACYFMPGPGPANANAAPISLSNLSECGILQLVPSIGRRATGRILYGVLCTQPCRMKSVMTVLADEHGEAVFIAFYNVGATETDAWSRIFPKGLRIGIKEPFLKRFADASIGIRVQNPDDIVYISRVCAWPKCRVAQVGDEIALLRCSKCKSSWYCSRACQGQDWGRHKLECRSDAVSNRRNEEAQFAPGGAFGEIAGVM